jgi:hypothetical protein
MRLFNGGPSQLPEFWTAAVRRVSLEEPAGVNPRDGLYSP